MLKVVEKSAIDYHIVAQSDGKCKGFLPTLCFFGAMDISTRSDLCALQDVIYHKELCDLDRPVIRKAGKFILLNKLPNSFRADAKHLADVLYSDQFGIVSVHRLVCLAHCYISVHRDSPFGAEEFGKQTNYASYSVVKILSTGMKCTPYGRVLSAVICCCLCLSIL